MFDLSKAVGHAKRNATAKIQIELGALRVILHCKPATEDNPAYHNAWARRNTRRFSRGTPQVTARFMDETRREDAELFAHHCVTGWDAESLAPFTTDGKPPKFSPTECMKFFESLLDEPSGDGREAFDTFRSDIRDRQMFVEQVDPAEVAEQAGNSQGA
ncbi:MAG: hypothetical protein OXE76_03970 [Alphaproteobacteria bacterium]|nr:hypothetical protein [Alphaproteobacteria bacterium]